MTRTALPLGADVGGEVGGDVGAVVGGDVGGEVGAVVGGEVETPPVQATPFRANAVGAVFVPVQAPLKPNEATTLVAITAL
jgi:hypothetical protein